MMYKKNLGQVVYKINYISSNLGFLCDLSLGGGLICVLKIDDINIIIMLYSYL